MRKILDFYRAVKLFCGIACRMYGTGKFRLFPYKYEDLLIYGTLYEDYKGKHIAEDFIWISPKLAWEIAYNVCIKEYPEVAR